MKTKILNMLLLIYSILVLPSCVVSEGNYEDGRDKGKDGLIVYKYTSNCVISQFMSNMDFAIKVDDIHNTVDINDKIALTDKYFPTYKLRYVDNVYNLYIYNDVNSSTSTYISINTNGKSLRDIGSEWSVLLNSRNWEDLESEELCKISYKANNIFTLNAIDSKLSMPYDYNSAALLLATAQFEITVSLYTNSFEEDDSIYQYHVTGSGEYSEIKKSNNSITSEIHVTYSAVDSFNMFADSINNLFAEYMNVIYFGYFDGALDITIERDKLDDGVENIIKEDINVVFSNSINLYRNVEITYKGQTMEWRTDNDLFD